ncbi:polysaccharide biosynthesis/export family protein [Roseiconus lacunae]|uniref:Polysaccharide biosynthesis/export family protein n=1 Tax=Roseiconus lacunae TaxID=2605694 RepID=A0ABT7PHE1_9BACT|nr:polysaccharide biosynthesis/export family protein [Roseiconus lacunae]MDM4015917.1 polysaccharide biosynthesis/export family protein [Roseiconus lacunae]WRQ51745.1 polysaccharide biosynthesis/export family protein [Stieleria sp. HD01]
MITSCSARSFAIALLLIVIGFSQVGCRTAASLGLPVSAGGHPLLTAASQRRQLAGHPGTIPTELAKQSLPSHRVEAGDVLVIEPNDFNSPIRLSSDQTVQQDGTIELGSYGRLKVAGLSAEEIQSQVQNVVTRTELAKRQRQIELASHRGNASGMPNESAGQEDYGVTVRLVNNESALFYVMGEVNAPGSYPLVGHETVLDAIIAAGGLTDRCNDHKIILTRPQADGQERAIYPVCYQQILQLGDVTTNYQLMPGDRIYVPSMSIWEDVKQSVAWGKEKSCPHCRDYSVKE